MGYAYRYLTIMCLWLPTLYVLHTFRSGLNGLSDTITPLMSGVIEFLTRAFISFLAVKWWAEEALMHAEAISWAGAAVLLLTVYLIHLVRLPKEDGRPDKEKLTA